MTKRGIFKSLAAGFFVWNERKTRNFDAWDDPEWLERWLGATRQPVRESDDPKTREWIRDCRECRAVLVRYFGGSEPGLRRLISPVCLNRVEGFPALYLTAFCHLRQKPRNFRIDSMERIS